MPNRREAEETGDRASTALLLYDLSDSAWRTGVLFFGLWLIPMGWCTRRSTCMPSVLGWVLMMGGVEYMLSAFVEFLAEDASTVVFALTVPATVGELWMVGYLLAKGLTPGLRTSLSPPNPSDRFAADSCGPIAPHHDDWPGH